MNVFTQFFFAAITAIVFQNAIITRGLGSSKEILMISSNRNLLWFGGFLTVYMFFSALLSWPVYRVLKGYRLSTRLGLRYFYSMTTLLCCCVIFVVMLVVTGIFFPKLAYVLKKVRIWVLFNCAVLGAILIAFGSGYTLVQTLGFATGSGVGYTGALLLVSEGRRRLSLADVPKAFRGLPVTLLYVGIFSLAVYGLIGHQLPT